MCSLGVLTIAVSFDGLTLWCGDAQGSGKSSLVLRFVKSQFFDYQESTIGAAFLTKTLPDQQVKFEIWCAYHPCSQAALLMSIH